MASGSITRRGSAWRVVVYAGLDPATGRKRQTVRVVHGTKKEAEAVRNELLVAADRGELRGTEATMAQLFERWYSLKAPDWSPKGALETRRLLDRVIIPALGAKRVTKVRTADLDRLYASWRNEGGVAGRPLSPASVQRYHTIVRGALNQAVKWGWLVSNPAVLTTRPKVVPATIRPPTPEQILSLLAHTETHDPETAVFLRLAAITGARRGEVCALRWSDLDGDSLKIERAIVESADGLVEKGTKTHGSRRVALDAKTADTLREHRRRCVERALACGAGLPDDAYLFAREPDGSVSWRPDYVSYRFSKLRGAVGLDGARLHDLRHAMATLMLAGGADVRTVAGRLGHRNVATTLNVYGHFIEASDRAAADDLGALIDGAESGTGQKARRRRT